MDQQPPTTEPPPKGKDTSWHNAIASFMSRRVHHIRARSGEWYRIHRNRGGGNGGYGGDGKHWLRLLLFLGIVWLAYHVFLWLVEAVRAVIHGVAEFLVAVTPAVIVIMIIGGVVVWYQQHKRGI